MLSGDFGDGNFMIKIEIFKNYIIIIFSLYIY